MVVERRRSERVALLLEPSCWSTAPTPMAGNPVLTMAVRSGEGEPVPVIMAVTVNFQLR